LDAYLDIETTGLSPASCSLTVIGVYLVNGQTHRFAQLVGDEISDVALLDTLSPVSSIYTYNGSRFDLPFIKSALNMDLCSCYYHHDLMYDCWRQNLRGGLKAVERQLGITRQLTEVNGWEAVKLWYRYINGGDESALKKLLDYNKEDVVNLKILRQKLAID
jgi:uncharacterized protein YprB with RNaseH-like and TPR domain